MKINQFPDLREDSYYELALTTTIHNTPTLCR